MDRFGHTPSFLIVRPRLYPGARFYEHDKPGKLRMAPTFLPILRPSRGWGASDRNLSSETGHEGLVS